MYVYTIPMKRTIRAVALWSVLFFLGLPILSGQDIHYTQFYNAPFQVSPSQIGLFEGSLRLQGNYRNQWRTVPVGYKTVTLAADKKFYSKKEYQFFAGGLVFNYDQAGFGELNNTQINILGSFTRRTSNKTYVTLGGIVGLNQRAFRLGELNFDTQNNGQGGFDPSIPSGEDFPNLSNNFADYSVGINFRFQDKDSIGLVDRLEKRTKFDVGLGVFHLSTPNQSFLDDSDVPLPIRLSPYIFGTLKLTDDFDFVGSFLVQFQATYRELLYGGAFKWHLSRHPGRQLAVQAGVNFRSHDFGESWSPTLEAHYNSWRVGLSYEVNTSGFQVATRRDSGPEISIRYLFKKVEPLPKYKICPLI
jgi:type IX secretion system PorP/SprF family membrane protein